MLTVGKLMTQRVISIHSDKQIHSAIELMLRNGISGLPVVGIDGKLLGILTEGDLLRRAAH